MTVCFNGTCPFEDYDTVTVISLDAVCRRYIGWLVDKLEGRE